VVSEEVWGDPQVQAVLSSGRFETTEESIVVRGLSEARKIYRIQARQPKM
jgi:hypothetical protein